MVGWKEGLAKGPTLRIMSMRVNADSINFLSVFDVILLFLLLFPWQQKQENVARRKAHLLLKTKKTKNKETPTGTRTIKNSTKKISKYEIHISSVFGK